MIKYERREKKDDKFDMLKYFEQIPYLDFLNVNVKMRDSFILIFGNMIKDIIIYFVLLVNNVNILNYFKVLIKLYQ